MQNKPSFSRNPTIKGSSQILKHPSKFNHPLPESRKLPLAVDIFESPKKGQQTNVNTPHSNSSDKIKESNLLRNEKTEKFIKSNSFLPLKENQSVPAAKGKVISEASPLKKSSPRPLMSPTPSVLQLMKTPPSPLQKLLLLAPFPLKRNQSSII